MDCSLPGSSVHGIFQARTTGVGCYFLGDLTNPGIETASLASSVLSRQILYHLGHLGSSQYHAGWPQNMKN